jgi:RHS repeat-associated protein
MSLNVYDKLGQLQVKKTGGTDLTGSAAYQNVDYAYNIRGWLKGINDTSLLGGDLFSFKINYNETITHNVNGQIVPLYNGNIAETSWRTSADNVLRRYGYKYDNLNRLTNAIYQKPGSAIPVANSYNESLTYDTNGNIMSLQRNGEIDDATTIIPIDNLTYTYPAGSNKLTKVIDSTMHSRGFKDSSDNTGDDYNYDSTFGNLTSDKNKGIASISYNHLNLPVEIIFSGATTKKIKYLYDATGVKVKKTVTEGAVVVDVDYMDGGYQYKNTILQFFPTPEGYVDYTPASGKLTAESFNYVFQYKDHLGNVRMNYAMTGGGAGELTYLAIKEENHYYPFGLKHENYNVDYLEFQEMNEAVVLYPPLSTSTKLMHNYKYNGKELQDELGLNMYDYGARNYDPAIGRWMNIDPMAETSRRWSPYTYCYNNPVVFVDPDGMQSDDFITINTKTKTAHVTETDDDHDIVTIDGVMSSTKPSLYTAKSLRSQGYEVTEAYAVGSTLSDWAGATFGFGKIVRGIYSALSSSKNSPSQTPTQDGKIYRVPGEKTKTGKPYVGRTKQESPAKRGEGAKDGRDRKDAEVIDKYDSSKAGEGAYKEQKAIDKNGGVKNLDNKRNEVSAKRMKELEKKYGDGQ